MDGKSYGKLETRARWHAWVARSKGGGGIAAESRGQPGRRLVVAGTLPALPSSGCLLPDTVGAPSLDKAGARVVIWCANTRVSVQYDQSNLERRNHCRK